MVSWRDSEKDFQTAKQLAQNWVWSLEPRKDPLLGKKKVLHSVKQLVREMVPH